VQPQVIETGDQRQFIHMLII